MTPFTEIDAFKNTVASVRRYCGHEKPVPTIAYTGTIKIHGSNAGVAITPDSVQSQKRTDICTIEKDNAGFAVFCHGKDASFRHIAGSYSGSKNFTLFGEWCGGNIQKNVAVSQLPKHFVIFAGYDGETEKYIHINDLTKNLIDVDIIQLNTDGIWFINQIPTYSITVDFTKPEDALAKLEEYTLSVEEECPWGKFRGVTGIGEGVVWQPSAPEYSFITALWFKTKGIKHQAKTGKATNLQATPEKLESLRAVVDAVLPAWRLEQGLTVLREQGLEIIAQNTGVYLQWVSKDILKEDADVLAANNLTWKEAVKYIMPAVRQYYLKAVDAEVFDKH